MGEQKWREWTLAFDEECGDCASGPSVIGADEEVPVIERAALDAEREKLAKMTEWFTVAKQENAEHEQRLAHMKEMRDDWMKWSDEHKASFDAERAAHEATKGELERMTSHMEIVLKICTTEEGYLPGGLQAATALTGSDRPMLRAAKQYADMHEAHEATRVLLAEAVGVARGYPHTEGKGGIGAALRDLAGNNQRTADKWTLREQRLVDWACALDAFLARPAVAAIRKEGGA